MIASTRTDLTIERFPETAPTRYYSWSAILRKKEEVAAGYPGRWIIHQDSDEILRSPWTNTSLRGGLFIAERTGFDAVDFTVCNFRPVDDTFATGMNPENHFRFFEFGLHPAYFCRVTAWRQGARRVDLARSGGHQAEFPGRKIFPYKFVLKHYPLRTSEQARRKVFTERLGRFDPDEREIGWHNHYDDLKADGNFLWDASRLIEFDEGRTQRLFLTEFIAGVGIT